MISSCKLCPCSIVLILTEIKGVFSAFQPTLPDISVLQAQNSSGRQSHQLSLNVLRQATDRKEQYSKEGIRHFYTPWKSSDQHNTFLSETLISNNYATVGLSCWVSAQMCVLTSYRTCSAPGMEHQTRPLDCSLNKPPALLLTEVVIQYWSLKCISAC